MTEGLLKGAPPVPSDPVRTAPVRAHRFPKSARLLKSRDFSFRPYQRYPSEYFTFVFTPHGQGRLGISISRKVLRRAAARNRVRRLLKEAFRLHQETLGTLDIHVVGQPPLKEAWMGLKRQDIERMLAGLKARSVGKDRE